MVAHNATLTIPLESTGQDGLYVSAVAVSGAAGIVLMDAQGAMDASGQNDPVSGSRVQFTGELGLQVVSASAGLPLRLNVGGNLQKLDVDGHVQTFSGKVSPDLPVLGASSAVLVGAVLVAAGAGAGFVVLRRRSRPGPDSVLQDGFDALQLGQWRRALRLARRAVKAEPLDADAHYLLGRSLAEAGRLRQALHHHERTQELLHGSRGVDGPLIAENAAAAAKATARLHAQAKGEETDSLHVRVLEWLRAAIEADPAMPSQLAVQPELVPFLRQIPLAKPDVPFWAKP
jgi:hypothetical protein